MTPALETQPVRQLPWSDERLVSECRNGNHEAWAALVSKYKNLVYSIPIKMGLHQEAADIFQAVFLELLANLLEIREPQALAKWLIQVCYHECLRCRQMKQHQVPLPDESVDAQVEPEAATLEDILIQGQREQKVRDAMRLLVPRCQHLIRMLFYEFPARPYQEVAKELGMATGSIGFIRGRCLSHLRKQLERLGFK